MNRFKNKKRLEEVKMLMQGLTVPEPPVVSRDAAAAPHSATAS